MKESVAAFFEKHRATEGWLINRDQTGDEPCGKGTLHLVPLWAWLLGAS